MQRKSWFLLAFCAVLAAFLGMSYLLSQPSPQTLTQQDAMQMLKKMQDAVAQKNVNAIMATIAPQPDTRIAHLNQDQLRLLLARAFHNTGTLRANYQNVTFTGGTNDATLEFDLTVSQEAPGLSSEDYKGHITLRLKRIDVPRFWGLFQAKEWRIVGADSSGPDPMNFGDY